MDIIFQDRNTGGKVMLKGTAGVNGLNSPTDLQEPVSAHQVLKNKRERRQAKALHAIAQTHHHLKQRILELLSMAFIARTKTKD